MLRDRRGRLAGPGSHPRPAAWSAEELRLEGVEREAILSALAITDGHHQRAADLLGISRRTLTRKLRAYRATPLASASFSFNRRDAQRQSPAFIHSSFKRACLIDFPSGTK